jgi:hypothetical protein
MWQKIQGKLLRSLQRLWVSQVVAFAAVLTGARGAINQGRYEKDMAFIDDFGGCISSLGRERSSIEHAAAPQHA